MDMSVIGLTGESGGQLLALTETCICAPAKIVWEIQELHLPIYHALCLMLEDYFSRRLKFARHPYPRGCG